MVDAGFSFIVQEPKEDVYKRQTATRLMLYSMLVASGTFFLIYYLFCGMMGNHALWMAFLIYLLLRGSRLGLGAHQPAILVPHTVQVVCPDAVYQLQQLQDQAGG